jgi:hypothetical protein
MKFTITIPERRRPTADGFSVKRKATQEEWERTYWHCPRCGAKSVFVDSVPGDFYVGSAHICITCRGVFYLPCDVETVVPDTPRAESADALAAHIKLPGS